jgi:flavin reductase (DIM6/NTAB) family NADH-FMN oxidoreductase RutF
MIYKLIIIFSCCLSLGSALQPTSKPPLLDVPIYALATLNKDGSTNMNILTYATPVSAHPCRVWSLGVYRETLSEENLLRKPVGVLQLLTKDHVDLVGILGGNSGRDIKKKEACAKVGFEWIRCDYFRGIQVLPGCASYLFLTIQGGVLDAGSHLIVPYCEVQSMYTSTEAISSSDHLRTSRLRDLGIITDQGRVADMKRDVANRGFRLQ